MSIYGVHKLCRSALHDLKTREALKADPETQHVKLLGFVSHVQTDTINAARAAGIDDVMARSAFAANLAEILRGGATS